MRSTDSGHNSVRIWIVYISPVRCINVSFLWMFECFQRKRTSWVSTNQPHYSDSNKSKPQATCTAGSSLWARLLSSPRRKPRRHDGEWETDEQIFVNQYLSRKESSGRIQKTKSSFRAYLNLTQTFHPVPWLSYVERDVLKCVLVCLLHFST